MIRKLKQMNIDCRAEISFTHFNFAYSFIYYYQLIILLFLENTSKKFYNISL